MKDEDKIRSTKPIEDIYKNLDNDRLLLICVNYLEENKIEPTFDKIVAVTHKMFPSRFSLIGFPEYADGKRVHDCLFHCTYKTKKWLEGSPKQGFRLSEMGKLIIQNLDKYQVSSVSIKSKFNSVRRKEKAIVDKIKKTKAYQFFLERKLDSLNPDYLKEALRCSPDASKLDLQNNYKIIENYAIELGIGEEINKFLREIKQRLGI